MTMRRMRPAWAILLAVVGLAAAARPLRDQAKGADVAQAVYEKLTRGALSPGVSDPLDRFRKQADAFVELHCASDAEMLMAAGILTPNAQVGEALLRRIMSRP